ncbi:hypothetical protein FACS189437_06950 [Bacteroidia bacterium]|nr:hypothetical protein FACS189437_06950 [Bacteroidia bacterium]
MLQKNEMTKLQNLLAIYQLQTTNGMVVQMATGGWEQDPDGNWHKISYPTNNGNSGGNSGGCDCCDVCCGTALCGSCCCDCLTCI